ncbi:hypothetical protein UlMin_040847 [Ulmus minor]
MGQHLAILATWEYWGRNSETCKEEVEVIDEENKSITFAVVDGNITQYYKNIKSSLQVTGKAEGGSSVKWTLEYEKKKENFPAPNQYLDLAAILTKQIDFHGIFKHQQHHINASQNVHAIVVLEGEWGTEGSVMVWNYFHVTPKDEGEGSILHWTVEYKKLHDEIIDPHTLLDLAVSKDLEGHLLVA